MEKQVKTERDARFGAARALWLVVPLVAALALLAVLRQPAAAATIDVVDGEVEVDDNGVCSLIEALENANDTADGQPFDDCAAGDPTGPDIVNLALNGRYEITRTYEEISITTPSLGGFASDFGLPTLSTTVTISGNGATIAAPIGGISMARDVASGARSDRRGRERAPLDGIAPRPPLTGLGDAAPQEVSESFSILPVGLGGDVTLQYVFIEGGAGPFGGSILNAGGDLNLDRVLISGAFAFFGGGVFCADGTLDMTETVTFANAAAFGGGLMTVGCETTILDSAYYFNDAEIGSGMLALTSTVSIDRSLFADNTSDTCTLVGGGPFLTGPSGGGSDVSIVNSTIGQNEMDNGAAVCNGGGRMTIDNSTISRNLGSGVAAIGNETARTVNYARLAATLGQWGRGLRDVPFAGQTASSTTAAGGIITLTQSIVTGNDVTLDGAEVTASGGFLVVSDGYNVLGDDFFSEAEAFSGFTPDATDFVASSDSPDATPLDAIINDYLSAFNAINEYFLLPTDSPAIDFVPSANCQTGDPTGGVDQAQDPRNQDFNGVPSANECDAGAAEMQLLGTVFAAARGGTADNPAPIADLAYTDGDVLAYDGESWSMYFDGTDHGINPRADIIALDVDDPAQDSLYLVWRQNQVVPGLGRVTPWEIVYFDGTSFSRFFDGRDVGLTLTSERINGLVVLNDDSSLCEEMLLISTMAGGKVPDGSYPPIVFTGDDVLAFCMSQGGADTQGTWSLAFDGAWAGLPRNSTLGLAAESDESKLYFTTKNTFPAGVNNVLSWDFTALDDSVFNFSDAGLTRLVDSIDFIDQPEPPSDPCLSGAGLAQTDC